MRLLRNNSSKYKGLIIVVAFVLVLTIFVASALMNRFRLMGIYESGIKEIESGNYIEGISILDRLGNYQDSRQLIQYATARDLLESQDYGEAIQILASLGEFMDSNILVAEIQNELYTQEQNKAKYKEALELQELCQYVTAISKFEELGDYEDSRERAEECRIALNRLIYSKSLSAGIRFSAAVTSDGKVMFSGRDYEDEDAIGTWDNIVSISSNGVFTIGLKNDGTVVTAQRSSYDYRIDASEWRDIVAVAAGEHYIVGLRADGTVTAQGHNGDGQIDIDDWENIIAIDAGWRHTVGLDSYGNVHIAGYASENLLGYIEDEKELWTDLVNTSAGGGGGDYLRTFVVGLKADGTAVAVGANEQGQCNIDEWSDLIAISAGDYHTVGLKSDGTVLTTDPDPSIQAEISSWQDIVAISAGYGYTLGLKSDGTVVAAGFGADGQSDVEGWSNIAVRKEWSLLFDSES